MTDEENVYLMIKNDLKEMTKEEVNLYISLLLTDYETRKKEKRLYNTNDPIPKIVIESYFECIDNPHFDTLISNFRKKYILNENKIESVHNESERRGLGLVYEYIQNFNDIKNLNIFTLLKIHEILYSKVPHPEFGGKFRVQNIFLPGSGTDTTNYDLIPQAIQALYLPVQELIYEGVEIAKNKETKKIIPYIDKCVELKCKLIKIHPFYDGNGRSIRAFINLLFKIANIPLVYIRTAEKAEYGKAMQIAVNEEQYEDIKTFYYYKVCDSIIDLDIAYNEEKLNKDNNLEEKNYKIK